MKNRNNKKVLVLGDSWAWCWYPNKTDTDSVVFQSSRSDEMQHNRKDDLAMQGIPVSICFPIWDFLLKLYHYDPQIIAKPGSSNNEQIDKLCDLLDSETPNPDIILLLQTDPLRDFFTGLITQFDENMEGDWEYRLIQKTGFHKWNADHVEQVIENTLLNIYRNLITCVHSRKLNIPIMLMGGLSTVDTELLKIACDQVGYYNVHVVSKHYITDSIALMQPQDQVPEYPHPCVGNRISHFADETWNHSLIEFLHDIHFDEHKKKYPLIFFSVWPDHAHGNAGITIVAMEIFNRYMDKLGI